MSAYPYPSSCRRIGFLAPLMASLFITGCVSTSMFEDFKHEIRRDITTLQKEQYRLERDIAALQVETKSVRNRQQELSEEVRGRLDESETKLKEMEDRVIEIRLQIQRMIGSSQN